MKKNKNGDHALKKSYGKLLEIQTRQDFISFLRDLKKDYLENLPSWENRDIGAFLEAMASWIEDMGWFLCK